MPPKPTCKVVKREGQRGARIDPKGCKVRTTKDAQGNKKKENKQGQQKIKRTTTKTDMRLAWQPPQVQRAPMQQSKQGQAEIGGDDQTRGPQ